MTRRRLDAELVRRGLVSSREQGRAAIEGGRVSISGVTATKAATQVDDASFDEELVRMLLEHSALQLDHFPFTLLPLENYAVNNNVQR